MDPESSRVDKKGMHKRQITLEDGRYLIFYTFEDEPAPSTENPDAQRPEPEPEPQAEEERRV